jgi:glutamate-1-semialdehyde 2,1-aminomutase
MPGGVNSPVRSFRAVGGEPLMVAKGEGAYVVDPGGRRYIDLVGSYGALLLGHAHPAVVEAITRQAARGTSYGAPTEAETELAELLIECVPSLEMVRLVSSGTEAAMSAVRLARAVTGRDLIIKFAGGYHGHADGFLAEAGSGLATLAIPSSPGVPKAYTDLTIVLPYNSEADLHDVFHAGGESIAAVIVEPVAGNMGVVPARPEFLNAARMLTERHGAVLIFDEVITGFRLGLGGAQEMYGITPDLTCLGKVIGGGLPLAAYGGRAELMKLIAPEGLVYQAGTLSGNPLATAAGLATIKVLREDPPYERLDHAAARVQAALLGSAARARVSICVNRVGSMLTPFLRREPVEDYGGARKSDTRAYAGVFHELLRGGVSAPPSQFEAWFLSTEFHDEVLAALEARIDAAFEVLAPVG